MASGSKSITLTTNPTSSSSITSSRALSDRRLFVSNLSAQLTDHDLLLLFKPHGTLKKLDLIFHKTGPQKGKPKGYAFVEFARLEEAEKAKKALEGKMVKGREIRINYATVNEESGTGIGPHRRKKVEEPGHTTTLSLLKNLKRNDSTDARIAAMEAKLSALKRRTEPESSTPSSASSLEILPPPHPSLPSKPIN